MIRKYEIIILWFIASVFIITGCKNPGNISLSDGNTPIPVKTITIPPIKDYVLVNKWEKLGHVILDLDGNMYGITSRGNIIKYNSQGMVITEWTWEDIEEVYEKKFHRGIKQIVTDNQYIYVLVYRY